MPSRAESEIEALFDRRLRSQMKSLASDEIVAEYRAAPDGPHSEALARILSYLRRAPMEGKLAVYCAAPDAFRLCRATGRRGSAPVVEGPVYRTEREAVVAVFEERIEHLRAG